uniref:Uncharacterized protein n=1 Tax=viral metagenome TaxID=1070528 RepID=A0A6C0BZZ5_9ZZZZ
MLQTEPQRSQEYAAAKSAEASSYALVLRADCFGSGFLQTRCGTNIPRWVDAPWGALALQEEDDAAVEDAADLESVNCSCMIKNTKTDGQLL